MNFSSEWFFNLEQSLRNAGLDSDDKSFDEIKSNLQNKKTLTADDFASACAYVILAGGFSQKTAKRKHSDIIKYLKKAGKNAEQPQLLAIFNNINKTGAILKIWQKRSVYRDEYYALGDTDSRLEYLSVLPHIGKITANHLARNLGENVVKYDIWIQRLGVLYAKKPAFLSKIDNGKLDADVRIVCDDMFAHLEKVTKLPRGYIDVVLWKACQNGYIKI